MKHVTLYLNVAMKPSPLSPASKVHRKKKCVQVGTENDTAYVFVIYYMYECI